MKQSYRSPLHEFKGSNPEWETPPSSLHLEPYAMHLWLASLDSPSVDPASLANLLSPDEVQRAERLLSPQRRDHFIVGRGILRRLVSLYTGDPPDRLRFTTGPHGKPALVESMTRQELTFNLAHSRGLALYGFARGLELGVDLERIRSDLDGDRLATRFYTPPEWEALQQLPPDERIRAFFTLWTCKEAVIKAIGGSLVPSLSHIEITVPSSLPPHNSFPPVSTPERTHPWHVQMFEPGAGYCAALATSTMPSSISYWRWST